jgi:tRNA(Ile2) C34 agmatinyltransferase TiaS
MGAAQAAVDQKPTCWRCSRVLAAYLGRPWSLRCRRCGAQNNSPKEDEQAA